MKKKHRIAALAGIVLLIAIFLMKLPSQDDAHAAFDNPLQDGFLFGKDPFLEDVKVRFLLFDRNKTFDIRTTPVDNMRIFLQSMDSFYLCEEDWMKEMKFCAASLKEQYHLHKNSLDPHVQQMLEAQKELIEKLDILIRDADSDSVYALEQSFHEYIEVYERVIHEEGNLI